MLETFPKMLKNDFLQHSLLKTSPEILKSHSWKRKLETFPIPYYFILNLHKSFFKCIFGVPTIFGDLQNFFRIFCAYLPSIINSTCKNIHPSLY